MALPALADVRRHYAERDVDDCRAAPARGARDDDSRRRRGRPAGWARRRARRDDAARRHRASAEPSVRCGAAPPELLPRRAARAPGAGSRALGLSRRCARAAAHACRAETARGAAAPVRVLPAPDAGARHPARAASSPRFASATSTAPPPIACSAEHGWDGRPLVGVAPGAAYGWAKRWPPERMGQLAARLARDAGAGVVIVGAAADRETVDIVVGSCAGSGRCRGRDPRPRRSGPICRRSQACWRAAAASSRTTRERCTWPRPWTCRSSVSSARPVNGRRHRCRAGAALDTAIVHTDVWCRPCMLRTCPIDHRCMTGIAVDDVIAPVLVALGHAPASRETP